MRFSSFMIGLGPATFGSAATALVLGAGPGSALALAGATFVLGQILYVGLVALMVREEARLDQHSADESTAAPQARTIKQRLS